MNEESGLPGQEEAHNQHGSNDGRNEDTSDRLTSKHRTMLEVESGLSPETIASRGYFTETSRQRMAELGFGTNQCRVPALVIPLFDVDGDLTLYTSRPDEPRTKDGKVI